MYLYVGYSENTLVRLLAAVSLFQVYTFELLLSMGAVQDTWSLKVKLCDSPGVNVIQCCLNEWGHVVVHLVEAPSYKPEGRGFDSRWCHWNFSLT